MPALPNVPKVLKATLHWLAGEDIQAITRFFISYTGIPPAAADLIVIANAILTAFGADAAAYFGAGNGLESVEVMDLSTPTSPVGLSTGPFVPGTRAGVALPAATCVMLNYELGRRYRGGHPRSYTPALVAGDLTNEQLWNGATLANYLTAWEDVFTAYLGSEWAGAGTLNNVNVSYFSGFTSVQNPVTLRWRNVPKLRVTPLVDLIVSVTPNPAPCFQTRRGLIP